MRNAKARRARRAFCVFAREHFAAGIVGEGAAAPRRNVFARF